MCKFLSIQLLDPKGPQIESWALSNVTPTQRLGNVLNLGDPISEDTRLRFMLLTTMVLQMGVAEFS